MSTLFDLTLFTPGPVNVPHSVLIAGARAMLHHRTPEFSAVLESVIERLKVIFGTQEDVLIVHTSGRGAMEGVLRNLFSKGDGILCICNGYFGEMFANIAESTLLDVTRVSESWLKSLELDEIEHLLVNNDSIKALTVVHSDTSTALLNPIRELGKIVRRNNRLLIVDCVSSIGAIPFEFDDWNVDVAITASQKGLMAPAGVSFVALNDRAWKAVKAAQRSSYYIDFNQIKAFYSEKRQTPGSTPVSLVASVSESLNLIFQEGLDARYQRHKFISAAIKDSLISLGLDLFPKGDFIRSDSLSAFYVPNGILPKQVVNIAREKYRIVISSGLGKYKDMTFRVGHLGMVTIQQALTLVSAFEFIMKELGISQSIGRGLTSLYDLIDHHKLQHGR